MSAYPNLCVIDISDLHQHKEELNTNGLVMDEMAFMALRLSLPARANFVISQSPDIKRMSAGKFYVIDCLNSAIRSAFSEGYKTLFVVASHDIALRNLAIAQGATIIS